MENSDAKPLRNKIKPQKTNMMSANYNMSYAGSGTDLPKQSPRSRFRQRVPFEK